MKFIRCLIVLERIHKRFRCLQHCVIESQPTRKTDDSYVIVSNHGRITRDSVNMEKGGTPSPLNINFRNNGKS